MSDPSAAREKPAVFDVRRLARNFYTWHFESDGRVTVGVGNKRGAEEATRRWVAKHGGRDVSTL